MVFFICLDLLWTETERMAHHLLVVLKYVGFFTISPASMDVCRLDTFRSVPEGVFLFLLPQILIGRFFY